MLHREMSLLQAMGVNAIRLFNTIPPKWVAWIRDEYGIYTAINHLMGRYGFESTARSCRMLTITTPVVAAPS